MSAKEPYVEQRNGTQRPSYWMRCKAADLTCFSLRLDHDTHEAVKVMASVKKTSMHKLLLEYIEWGLEGKYDE